MKPLFAAIRKYLFGEIRRPHPARWDALASGAICAFALGAMMSPTATAYHFGQRALAVPTPFVSGGARNPSPGCGRHPVKTGTYTLTTFDGAGRTRSFLIDVPVVYNPNDGYPIVAVYHGQGGSSAESYSWGLQNGAASGHGIFVFPQGIPYAQDGIGWDDTTDGYDIPFFDNILTVVEAAYCVDTKRIFAAGFSWGGDFVTALTCNRGDVIRAVAVNSATDEFGDNSNYLTYADMPCGDATHSAMRYEHAYAGDAAYPKPDFATTSSLYGYFNACAATSTPYKSSTSVMTCVSHNSCAAPFIECAFNANIGHTLPPNWAADTWAFFVSFT